MQAEAPSQPVWLRNALPNSFALKFSNKQMKISMRALISGHTKDFCVFMCACVCANMQMSALLKWKQTWEIMKTKKKHKEDVSLLLISLFFII